MLRNLAILKIIYKQKYTSKVARRRVVQLSSTSKLLERKGKYEFI